MVSVIIPVHNGEKTIRRCVNSVLNQDVEIEVIVVDDFSTDKTVEILTREYPDVRVLNLHSFHRELTQATGSPNYGRNLGIKMARGKYVALLDHDDEWLPGKLKAQLEAMDKTGCAIATCGWAQVPVDKPKNSVLYANHGGISALNGFVRMIKRDKTFYPQYCTLMFERSLYVPMETTWGIYDYAWKLQMFEQGPVCRVNTVYVKHYISDTSLSTNWQVQSGVHFEAALTLNHYANKYPELADDCYKSIKTYFGSLARRYYKAGDYKRARYFFYMANLSLVNIAYILTSFVPFVRRISAKV